LDLRSRVMMYYAISILFRDEMGIYDFIKVASDVTGVQIDEPKIDEVIDEFNQLFVNPFGERLYPIKGKYVNGNQAEIILDIVSDYLREGYSVSDGVRPDHISVITEFIGMMLEKGKVSVANEFIAKHTKWIIEFCKKIESRGRIYRPVAKLVREFIKQELQNSKLP